ncbi:unnamed protein product [Discosporangium mesarthrocarpum]
MFYLYDVEDLPPRKLQHENHIVKVMFLGAVANPRHDTQGNVAFDGKVGIYPFVRVEAA